MGMKQRQLLAAVDPILGISMSSTIRRGTSSKLSQNSSIIAAIIRFSAIGSGRFSSRHMVGWEQSSAPLSGSRPTAILKAGSVRRASQSLASS
jgi:hypothetical protein